MGKKGRMGRVYSIWRIFQQAEKGEESRRIREQKRTPKKERPRCGARTRAGGSCQARAVWDMENDRPRTPNGRCRMHGGLSTGPRTAEGKRRSREGCLKARRNVTERIRAEKERLRNAVTL